MTAKAARIAPNKIHAAPALPLAERGRMLFLKDVQQLFGTDEKGAFRKSLWWVKRHFAPEYKRHLGRSPYWWEVEALQWLDQQQD